MSNDLRNVDVAIVGGGIVGCAVALAARQRRAHGGHPGAWTHLRRGVVRGGGADLRAVRRRRRHAAAPVAAGGSRWVSRVCRDSRIARRRSRWLPRRPDHRGCPNRRGARATFDARRHAAGGGARRRVPRGRKRRAVASRCWRRTSPARPFIPTGRSTPTAGRPSCIAPSWRRAWTCTRARRSSRCRAAPTRRCGPCAAPSAPTTSC